MNFNTLVSIFELKNSVGTPLIQPETDANGNFVIFEKPVALCPSVNATSVATGKPVLLGDMSRFLVRTVKNSLKLQRFEQAQALAENGMVAFEAYLRSNSGLLLASGSDSPIKYLTLAA